MANDWEGVVEIDAATFVAMGEEKPGEAPLRRVRITNLTPELMDAFVASPRLKHVTHLDLSGNRIGHDRIRALFVEAQLGELTHFDLSGNRILDTIEEISQAACGIRLEKLRDLRLANNGIYYDSMEHLIGVRSFSHLENLDLRGNRLDAPHGARVIADYRYAGVSPDLHIAVDGFEGSFADFQKWARGLGRSGGAGRGG